MKHIWKILGILLGIVTMGLLGGSAFQKNKEKKEEERKLLRDKLAEEDNIDKLKAAGALAAENVKIAKENVKIAADNVTKAKEVLAAPKKKRKTTATEATANLKNIASGKRRSRKPKVKN